MTFENLGKLPHRLREFVEVRTAMGVEFDLNEKLGVEADLAAIDQRDPALDEAFALQPINSAPAGRDGQANLLCNLAGCQGRVLLQPRKNLPLIAVKLVAHFFCLHPSHAGTIV